MKINVVVPKVGESVSEADIGTWYKKDGEYVEIDEEIVEIETEKATMSVAAEKSGTLKILVKEAETVKIGDVIAEIDTINHVKKDQASLNVSKKKEDHQVSSQNKEYTKGLASPAAEKMIREKNIDSSEIRGTGKAERITKQDVNHFSQTVKEEENGSSRVIRREKMTRLRKTIASRLKEVKTQSALLTTFNEVDMSAVTEIRKKYKEIFKKKYQVNLGFMSFFTKAVCLALKRYPIVNAFIENNDIVYHDYVDVSIAVSTPKGLVVPVLKNADKKSFQEIEKMISLMAQKGKEGTLSLDDMSGGTFTITNGGVFGSMLSTPIINYPQSAILGMHSIVKRPVAKNDEIVIAPVMYLAVTYDHRLIDGLDAVRFLVSIKEQIEDPTRLLIDI